MSKSPKKTSYVTNTLPQVQRRTLEFLRNYMADNGCAPALKDIAEHIGVKSASTAHFHLERLEAKGFIKRGKDGSLELFEPDTPELSPCAVPLVGVIAAGTPVDAIENVTTIDIPPNMLAGKGEIFCLEVSGESMIEASIKDKDIVVVKKQQFANDGDIVVAHLTDGSATLKYFRRLKSGKVMLLPANSSMQPITLDQVEVQGKVIGLLRYFN